MLRTLKLYLNGYAKKTGKNLSSIKKFLVGRENEKKFDASTAKIQQSILDGIAEIEKLTREIDDSRTYLIYPKKEILLSKIDALKKEIVASEKDGGLGSDFLSEAGRTLNYSIQFISSYNDKFIEQRKTDYSYLWNKNSIYLDDEQQSAIVTDDKYNLVVAAAGSGKTEVLITRIAYLIQRKLDRIEPNRILAIAFQRKAMEQIKDRLFQRYSIEDVNVATFHKLGKDILERSGRTIDRTDIVDGNKKYGFIKSYFEENVTNNAEFYKLFISYIKRVNDTDKAATQSDKADVISYAKEQKYTTINGVKVNSIAEKEIMDYLLTHKFDNKPIEVKYEPDLDGFRPDFYLPQFNVFIEHWGVDEDGNVPEWFSQTNQEYNEIMEKKKKWFAENNRMLVETFAYEFNSKEPELFCELLREKIQNVVRKQLLFSSLTYGEVLELVWQSQKTPIEDIENFITIAKTYGLDPNDIAEKLNNGKWSTKQLAFGRLALNVFRAYEAQLDSLGKIDFEDMINEATAELENNSELCKDLYDHILVDEYQDISSQRLGLLKKLLERNPNCRLFCVGDDWQSIMGFSGSNLNYFVNFSSYFDHPAISQIRTNYRSSKSIVDTGAQLIKSNGEKQVQKIALSKRKEGKPLLVFESTHKEGYDKQYFRQTVDDCLTRISDYLSKGYSPDDILVLTRFIRTKVLGRSKWFKIVETFYYMAKDRGITIAIDNAKLPNAVRLLTVHKCKGLEAKVVFVLNVVSGEFGFPSEIEDPSILEVARGDNGIQDQTEEERRLFYVAITRAKEDLYIYTRLNSKSRFLEEIATHSQPVTMNY